MSFQCPLLMKLNVMPAGKGNVFQESISTLQSRRTNLEPRDNTLIIGTVRVTHLNFCLKISPLFLVDIFAEYTIYFFFSAPEDIIPSLFGFH